MSNVLNYKEPGGEKDVIGGEISVTGELALENGGVQNLESGATINVKSGATANVNSSGKLNLKAGSQFQLAVETVNPVHAPAVLKTVEANVAGDYEGVITAPAGHTLAALFYSGAQWANDPVTLTIDDGEDTFVGAADLTAADFSGVVVPGKTYETETDIDVVVSQTGTSAGTGDLTVTAIFIRADATDMTAPS